MFNRNYEIKYHEVDFDSILKPSALFEYLEDVAAKNADSLDFGYNEITSKNYGWFLLKYAMDFYDYPQNENLLKIATEPRGANKLFAYRDFYIYGANDTLLGKIASTWGLIDLSTKVMLNPFEAFDKMVLFEKKEDDIKYIKIPKLTEISAEKTFEVRYDDIDVNCHVNNATYIVWALEALPFEFKKSKKIKRLDINYKKEITYGSNVISKVQVIENASVHHIMNAETGEDLCLLNIIWA